MAIRESFFPGNLAGALPQTGILAHVHERYVEWFGRIKYRPWNKGEIKMKYIAFDVFGTLIQAPAVRHNPYQRLMSPERKKELRHAFMTRNSSIEEFAQELGLEHLIPTLQQELLAEMSGYKLFPDVQATFSRLRKQGTCVAICSNLAHAYGAIVRRLLSEADVTILSFEVGCKKPEPEMYAKVCEAFGCKPRDVVFIGDSPRNDVEGPTDFGMHGTLIDRGIGQTIDDVLRGVR